jgi:flagella basal body P-ring formation protein FlgA
MRLLIIAVLFSAAAGAAAAQPVQLRQSLTDADGRVTLGDLFDGAGNAANVVIATMRPGNSAILDAATVQRQALTYGLAWANDSGLRRVIVRPTGAAAPAATHNIEALTYVRSLAAGEMVGPADIAWTKVAGTIPGAPRDSDAVIGMAAKRPLRAGQMVSISDVSSPQVVKKDDVVAVTYAVDGVSLTLEGKALQSAAAGESFNVLNPSSKKIIQAVAVGAGQAVVGPQAQLARASAQTFASLR